MKDGMKYLLFLMVLCFHQELYSQKNSSPCKDITKKVDDFTGEIKYDTPLGMNLGMLKSIHGSDTSYYLTLNLMSTYSAIGDGAYILFTDGTKWLKPEERIDIRYLSGGYYMHYSFTRISLDELVELESKTIKKIKLYISESEIPIKDAEKFNKYISCLKSSI